MPGVPLRITAGVMTPWVFGIWIVFLQTANCLQTCLFCVLFSLFPRELAFCKSPVSPFCITVPSHWSDSWKTFHIHSLPPAPHTVHTSQRSSACGQGCGETPRLPIPPASQAPLSPDGCVSQCVLFPYSCL